MNEEEIITSEAETKKANRKKNHQREEEEDPFFYSYSLNLPPAQSPAVSSSMSKVVCCSAKITSHTVSSTQSKL